MSKQDLLSAQRKIGFLKTFEKKFQGLRREFERLQRASTDPKAFGGRWPTGGLDRITRSLANTAVLNDLQEITNWCRNFHLRLDKIKSNDETPSDEDFDWLAGRIQELQQLRDTAMVEAEQVVSSLKPPSVPPERLYNKPHQMPLPSDPPARRPSGAPEAAARPAASTIVHTTAVVSVDTPSLAKQVILILKRAEFDIQSIPLKKHTSEQIRDLSPDLVIVDEDDLSPGGDKLIHDLARDPLTDYIPVLRLTTKSDPPERGMVSKPIVAHHLIKEARRAIGPESQSLHVTRSLKSVDLTGLIEFVNSEIRAGVVDAALGPYTDNRFGVLEEAPLIASVWELIATLRRSAAEGSKGKIRFTPPSHGKVGMMALAEAEQVLDPSSYDLADENNLTRLPGLSVVVADDDADTRREFDKVLSEAGMKVRLAGDGEMALKMIRDNPPDLLITDILMPKMDGWELYNILRHDFSLKHIPIIVISWKKDFLQRIKELHVDANDFLLKEMDRKQILRRVARVLKPKFALAQQLEGSDPVSGRVERVGTLTILYEVMRLRPKSRIIVRENWNYFEIDIADGELASVTRTSSDGSFHSGNLALEFLLGVSGGRFSVINAVEAPRQTIKEGTRNAIHKATKKLNDLVAHIVDGSLLHIERFELDEDLLKIYSKIVPTKLKDLLDELQNGASPRQIILGSAVSPDVLEVLLLDLVHRGAVQNIVSTPSYAPGAPHQDQWAPPAENAPLTQQSPLAISSTGTEEERSSTITLTLDDISEIASRPPPAFGPESATPPPLATISKKSSRIWPVLTVILLIGLGISAYFNLALSKKEDRPAEDTGRVAVAPDPTPPPQTASITPPAATEENPAVESSTDAKAEDTDPATAKKDPPPSSGTGKTTSSQKSTKRTKPREKKSSGRTPKNAGTLKVTKPPDAPGAIRISVDGKLRGRAPLKVKLAPGLHEVVFSYDGRRTMRMVTIQTGKSKSIVAKVP